ncbi:MAG TPA: PucC family protein, partial [Anaerolineae bacterium]|nr:PucC family protein [Anaerolineae bacterium]
MATTDSQVEISAPAATTELKEASRPFSLGRVVRLSTFQIGSAMADIFTAGVWNRIMISDFGIPAWPVGLLLALRYFLAPISLWVGHRS